MKKNNNGFLIWFAVIAVIVFASAVFLKGRSAVAPGNGPMILQDAQLDTGAPADIDAAANPVPDDVSTAPAPDGDEIVANATAGYHFSMPSNWYLERNASTGVAIYPDYDPASGIAAECKIELSMLLSESNNGSSRDNGSSAADLNAWLTSYLHADPTANVAEISRTPIEVGAANGTSSAIEWHGILNGVTTTLVYAEMPAAADSEGVAGGASANRNILEIAPSTLSEASDADNDDCDFDLQALVANLEFGAYEP